MNQHKIANWCKLKFSPELENMLYYNWDQINSYFCPYGFDETKK